MSRRRWIADEWGKNQAALTGANARHLAQVLRAQVGQTFEIAHQGEVRLGAVSQIFNDKVIFTLGGRVEAASLQREINLVLALFKFDRFEWAIEKVTELGVGRIMPVIATRTEVHLAKAAQKRLDRWRRIAHEASQQSRRAVEPMIDEPVRLDRLHLTGTKILLSENEKATRLMSLLGDSSVTLAIGPEGGWTPQEENNLQETGWEPATLGPQVLRAETAAIAAVSVVMSL